ncbi:hypothetical protein D5R81_19915 [Parashewanella spongiae]|uniref:Uncharacterized protein n=1 Tax=Parashewanella spongiae TaxID=342950 RepID=A0A3A6TML2_9GAMM|nr:hypothetical protein [Parashewanella spongiae]MCL1080297.1 hypothetical protein [Parashewanella spongiae]RJY01562.1 hypothetical protein D5R81_19915 [Parashewanella spongiae]
MIGITFKTPQHFGTTVHFKIGEDEPDTPLDCYCEAVFSDAVLGDEMSQALDGQALNHHYMHHHRKGEPIFTLPDSFIREVERMGYVVEKNSAYIKAELEEQYEDDEATC